MELMYSQGSLIAERYRILDILGQGGSGITYAAQDIEKERQVAIKALSLHRLEDWKALELFEREALTLARLEHPAIPRYLEYFHTDTPADRSFYLVQELAKGQSLAKLVENGWHANEAEVKRIASEILKILNYLHSFDPPVIHRDIKPDNIIRGENGEIYLVDFGAVKNTYHNTLMRGSTVVGTYGYMALEQFQARAFPASDLYGLGATLLFLLTHRSPAELPTQRLKIDFRSRVQISDDFAEWLEKMLEPDVEDRFASAKEALDALQGKKETGDLIPWQAIVGVGAVGIAAAMFLNSNKWAILPRFGFFPLGICQNPEVVENYLQQGGNPNAWMGDGDRGYLLVECAAINGNIQVVEILIAADANVSFADESINTPLHFVKSAEVAEVLIANGADVNVKNASGQTPLHTIAGNKDLVDLLLANGADVNATDVYGTTPLHQALNKSDALLAKLLINRGADVNARNNHGTTPLHQAIEQDNYWLPGMLIDKGADVNTKNSDGSTPLHEAVNQHDYTYSKLLIERGADVNARDSDGKTPLHIAAKKGNLFFIELLIASGADLNAIDSYGNTPLREADFYSRHDAVKLLTSKGADSNKRQAHPKQWNY